MWTLPELASAAECFAFGHEFEKGEDGRHVCIHCGEVRRKG